MTNLSPAAQAVLDAVNKELDEAPWNLTFIAGPAAAAALRAASDQAEIFFDAYDEPRRVITVDDLLNIAAEVDGGAR